MIDKLSIYQNKMKRKFLIQEISSLLLSFLFGYTAIAKLYDWRATKLAMYNQVIPDWSKEVLLIGVPLLELVVSLFLLIPAWRKWGLKASILLMSVFTVYVAWVWLGLAGRVPCSCGGVISSLTWGQHLIFNLVFLGISIVGWRKSVP